MLDPITPDFIETVAEARRIGREAKRLIEERKTMVTQDTAARIYTAYREIEAGKKLLRDMAEAAKEERDDHRKIKKVGHLKDHWGRRRDLQLHVPSGEDAHSLFNIKPELAVSVINAHIAHCEAELIEANEQARLELDIVPVPAVSDNPADHF